jgi:ankyrin repeat protein
MKLELPMDIANGNTSTTIKVWEILMASRDGNLEKVKELVNECPDLIYAQYNYTPPIHFAVREGHIELVKYLLDNGAHDPTYKIYPFLDNLITIAEDRNYHEIASLLQQYAANPSLQKFKGDNGKIHYNRSEAELEFEKAVDKEDIEKTETLLKKDPKLALDKTFFWGEGILMRPAKEGNQKLMELLMSYGARVPSISKWPQFYYFERFDSAEFLLEKGMNPNHMTWHHVTLLHDMAQKGNIPKAELLIKHGAEVNALEEEYHSTPLGMAARWGHVEMVKFLLHYGADPGKSSAAWSTPLKWAIKKGHTEIEEILRKEV